MDASERFYDLPPGVKLVLLLTNPTNFVCYNVLKPNHNS